MPKMKNFRIKAIVNCETIPTIFPLNYHI